MLSFLSYLLNPRQWVLRKAQSKIESLLEQSQVGRWGFDDELEDILRRARSQVVIYQPARFVKLGMRWTRVVIVTVIPSVAYIPFLANLILSDIIAWNSLITSFLLVVFPFSLFTSLFKRWDSVELTQPNARSWKNIGILVMGTFLAIAVLIQVAQYQSLSPYWYALTFGAALSISYVWVKLVFIQHYFVLYHEVNLTKSEWDLFMSRIHDLVIDSLGHTRASEVIAEYNPKVEQVFRLVSPT